MKIPKAINDVIDSFQKLPGIGPKTAQRLTYYLLHVPQTELDSFAESLSMLKKNTVLCSICKNVTESDPCYICLDTERDQSLIMVVEQPIDLLAFERSGKYRDLCFHGD
jgi:recombination protein RecR